MTLAQFCSLMALFCFTVSAYIDFPFNRAPDRTERNYGNFFISLGFCWVAFGWFWMR